MEEVYPSFCENGSKDILYLKLKNSTKTSVANQTKTLKSFTVYPNPSSSYLNIKSDEDFKEILLFSSNGALVKILDPNGENTIHDLKSGSYFIRASTDNGSAEIIQFVKTK